MAIAEKEIHAAIPADLPSRRLLTRADFQAMAAVGIFGPEERAELIEGDVFDMAPIGPLHNSEVDEVSTAIRKACGDRYRVRIQSTISLSDTSEPQPDIAVVENLFQEYRKRNPTSAEVCLIVEVAESSLEFDRTVKLPLYAAARIPEYWIINLAARHLEVYRSPSGLQYQETRIYHVDDAIEPLFAPGTRIEVSELIWKD